jgi:hypothetical protein
MPFDRRHVLAQWGGTLPGGEIWSNSIRLASDGTGNSADVPDFEAMQTWLHGPAKDAVAAFHARADTGVHAQAKLTFLKMNVVDMNGHYIENTTFEHAYSPVVAGGSQANLHPNQCTLVVSTCTAFERGPAHRGRFYLPLCAKSIDSATGGIGGPEAMLVAVSAATFLSELHDQPGIDAGVSGDVHVCVMSSQGTGATNRIIAVEVGTVIDTQRRRRNAMTEVYQRAALV